MRKIAKVVDRLLIKARNDVSVLQLKKKLKKAHKKPSRYNF